MAATNQLPQPQPGDFAVVDTGSKLAGAIVSAETVADLHSTKWDHAVICSRVDADGTAWIVEGEGSGAVEKKWHYGERPHKWSTGIVTTSPAAGSAAQKYVGVPYSYLDYVALTLHSLHTPVPGLKNYIASTRHMICSQLVDQAEKDAGVHLFKDNRWPGYVKPSDLGRLLGA
jgi:hypothetical protein